MAEEQLRRSLGTALDPGADFPDRLLLSRTMAALKASTAPAHRRSWHRLQVSPRAMTLLATLMVVALATVWVGAYVVINQFAHRNAPATHSTLIPATGVATGNLSAFSADDAAVWGLQPQASMNPDTSLFITHDGGKNWLPVTFDKLPKGIDPNAPLIPQAGPPTGVTWIDARHIVVNEETAIYSTADGGFSWQTSALQMPAHLVDPFPLLRVIDAQRAFAVTSDIQLYMTRDAGKTWIKENLVQVPASGYAGLQSQGPFLFGARGIFGVSSSSDLSTLLVYTTVDGGLTWSPPRRVTGISVNPVSPDEWWVIDRFGGLSRSVDAGITWQQIPIGDVAGVNLTRVMPVGGRVLWAVAGDEILLRSTDTGAHWSVVRVPS